MNMYMYVYVYISGPNIRPFMRPAIGRCPLL